ncbi:DUF933 domain-containing protein [Thermoproteota archaeon]
MKVAVFGLENFDIGKYSLDDERLDGLEAVFKPKKTTTIQIDFVAMDEIKDAEVVLTSEEKRADLIITDLDYVSERLAKEIPDQEKALFTRMKETLEKEELLFPTLTEDERKTLKGYPLISRLPVCLAKGPADSVELDDDILKEIYYASGRIGFFTGGPKDVRMWSVRKGTTAYEAAGCIHSDIQAGFIRAEVCSVDDILSAGHYNQVKNEGKVRLEEKDYIVQDGDYIIFLSNK